MLARLAVILSLLLPALGAVSCTVDGDVVENKKCTPVGGDPNKDCVKGYECRCDGPQGDCVCRKIQTLMQLPAAESTLPDRRLAPPCDDPNVRFLRRLGLFRD